MHHQFFLLCRITLISSWTSCFHLLKEKNKKPNQTNEYSSILSFSSCSFSLLFINNVPHKFCYSSCLRLFPFHSLLKAFELYTFPYRSIHMSPPGITSAFWVRKISDQFLFLIWTYQQARQVNPCVLIEALSVLGS